MHEGALPVLLRSLKLATIRSQWTALQEEAISNNWTYGGYLQALCELEVAHRAQSRLERYLKDSKLTPGKNLETFDFKHPKTIKKAQVVALCEQVEWAYRAENVLIFGPSGVGKSHLAQAIGHALVKEGIRVLFSPATLLIQQLEGARQALKLSQGLRRLDKYQVVIVDDMGYLQSAETRGNVLFELIADRYEHKSLVMTSNQAFGEWDKLFGDSSLTVAAIDRLVHHAHIIEIHGASYRKQQFENRARSPALAQEMEKGKLEQVP